jgi:hypothetical protein
MQSQKKLAFHFSQDILLVFASCVMVFAPTTMMRSTKFWSDPLMCNGLFKAFVKMVKAEVGAQYLHRCPTENEVKRCLTINHACGFPGVFASWDCKHFSWNCCPNKLAGQHKGSGETNTIVLEAICDGDLYCTYGMSSLAPLARLMIRLHDCGREENKQAMLGNSTCHVGTTTWGGR